MQPFNVVSGIFSYTLAFEWASPYVRRSLLIYIHIHTRVYFLCIMYFKNMYVRMYINIYIKKKSRGSLVVSSPNIHMGSPETR